MRLSVEHKMFSPGFFKESLGHFRQWLDDREFLRQSSPPSSPLTSSALFLLVFHDAWVACHDADVLIESPSAMAG